MLHFEPTKFVADTAILSPQDAFEQLVRTRCAKYPNETHHPRHPDYRLVEQEVNGAEGQIKAALESGALPAFTWLPDTYEHFAIPREYWLSTLSFLSGKIFSFPAEQVVPPQFDERPIAIRRQDWLAWLAAIGLELYDLVATPVAVSIGREIQPCSETNAFGEVKLAPWLSTLQALGLIATGDRECVYDLSKLEAEHRDEMGQTVAFAFLQVHVAKSLCNCNAQGLPECARPGNCICTGNAGRRLLEAIQAGKITPVRIGRHGPSKVSFYELAGVGLSPNAEDWIAAGIGLQFATAEVSDAFELSGASRETTSDVDVAPKEGTIGSTGRPNQRTEAIEIHQRRLRSGAALPGKAAEARAIRSILMLRHANDPGYAYEATSIARAIRDWANGEGG